MKKILLVVIALTIICCTKIENKMYGVWQADETLTVDYGKVSIKGDTEYLRNKTSTFTGEITLHYDVPNGSIEISYSVTETGEWQIDNDKILTEKVIDYKGSITSVKVNGQEIDQSELEEEFRNQLKLENIFPKGLSTESTILEISDKKMRTESKDEDGKMIESIAYRK